MLAHPLPTCSPSRPVILNFPHKETRPVLGLLITPAMPFLMRDYLLVAANKLVGFIKMDAVDKGSPAFLVLSN